MSPAKRIKLSDTNDDDDEWQPTKLLLDSGEEEEIGSFPIPDSKPLARQETPYVFISHTGQDHPSVKRLLAHPAYWFLTEILSVEAFMDEQSTRAGDLVDEAVSGPALQCTHALVLLSPMFRRRPYCVWELNTFTRRFHDDRNSIRVLLALWDLNNTDGYSKDIKKILWLANPPRTSAVDYLVQYLWPRLADEFGTPATKARLAYEQHLFDYVELHRAQHYDIPAEFERFVERMRGGQIKPSFLGCDPNWRKVLPESTTPWPNDRELHGREQEVAKIKKQLNKKSAMVAIVGEAGIGKTHLAEHVALDWVDADPANRCAFWFEAETEASLRRDYERALKKIYQVSVSSMSKDPDQKESKTPSELATEFCNALAELNGDFDWIIVYNNVPEHVHGYKGFEGFKAYFFSHIDWWNRWRCRSDRKSKYRGRVMLTTRREQFSSSTEDRQRIPEIKVGPLSSKACISILTDDLDHFDTDSTEDMNVADRLVSSFRHVPHPIWICNADIKRQFERNPSLTMKLYLHQSQFEANSEAAKTLYQNSVSDARDCGYGSILDVASFVSPEDIPAELLLSPESASIDQLEELVKWNMLQARVIDGVTSYSMHRLNQEVARTGRSMQTALEALHSVFTMFDDSIISTWAHAVIVLPHLSVFVAFYEKNTHDSSLDLVFARTLNCAGLVQSNVQGSFDGALEHYQKALAVFEPVLGVNHPDTATSYNNIGLALSDKGDYDGALEHHQKASAVFESVLGVNHPDTATSYSNIGAALSGKGDYDGALEHHQKALAVRESVLGVNHRDTATSYSNIGAALSGKGDYDGALEHHQKALAVRESVLGVNHPDTATSYSYIGRALSDKGDYDGALEHHQKALAVRESVLGVNHPDTATSYSNIGAALSGKGDYDGALEHHQKALAVRESVLGVNHPDTATSHSYIGAALYDKGDYDGALEHHQKALAVRESVLGVNHPDTATSYSNIGAALSGKGDYDGALEHHQKDLAVRESVLGVNHPGTATSYSNIGAALSDKGDYDGALEHHQKALAVRESVLGVNHPDTATSYNNIGAALYSKGDYDSALEYHQKALAVRESVLGVNHPGTATSYSNIGAALYSKGDYDGALEHHQKDLAICESVLGVNHPDTATSYSNIGAALYSKGDYDGALEHHQKALAVRESVLGVNHPDTATSYSNIGRALSDKGDYNGALEHHQKELAICKSVLGVNHPDTATSYSNIGRALSDKGDYNGALEHHQKALAVRESVLGVNHPDTATSYSNIGRALSDKGDYNGALEHHQKALAVHWSVLVVTEQEPINNF